MKYILILTLAISSLWACSDSSQKKDTKETEAAPVATTPINNNDTIVIKAMGANMNEIRYDIKTLKVPADKEITIALVNESTDASMPHNIVFIEQGTATDVGNAGYKFPDNGFVDASDKNVIASSPLVQINETAYFSFTTPSAGDYEFICSYPGHWGRMKGKFIAE